MSSAAQHPNRKFFGIIAMSVAWVMILTLAAPARAEEFSVECDSECSTVCGQASCHWSCPSGHSDQCEDFCGECQWGRAYGCDQTPPVPASPPYGCPEEGQVLSICTCGDDNP
jgi:hypothetical protein